MQELRRSDSMIAILQSTQDALECDQIHPCEELSIAAPAVLLLFLLGCFAFALDPSLDISQFG